MLWKRDYQLEDRRREDSQRQHYNSQSQWLEFINIQTVVYFVMKLGEENKHKDLFNRIWGVGYLRLMDSIVIFLIKLSKADGIREVECRFPRRQHSNYRSLLSFNFLFLFCCPLPIRCWKWLLSESKVINSCLFTIILHEDPSFFPSLSQPPRAPKWKSKSRVRSPNWNKR